MASTNTNPKTKLLSVVLPSSERERVIALAKSEDRTMSKMAVILIGEALNARDADRSNSKQAVC